MVNSTLWKWLYLLLRCFKDRMPRTCLLQVLRLQKKNNKMEIQLKVLLFLKTENSLKKKSLYDQQLPNLLKGRATKQRKLTSSSAFAPTPVPSQFMAMLEIDNMYYINQCKLYSSSVWQFSMMAIFVSDYKNRGKFIRRSVIMDKKWHVFPEMHTHYANTQSGVQKENTMFFNNGFSQNNETVKINSRMHARSRSAKVLTGLVSTPQTDLTTVNQTVYS